MESLPMAFVKGTHFEVGKIVGNTFKRRIRNFYGGYDSLAKKFLPFYETEKGRRVYEGYLEAATKHFPQYVEELKGMSEGSEIPFHHMFLMQINMELAAILENLAQYECSTVFLNGGGGGGGGGGGARVIAHNEDTHPLVKDFGYVVAASIVDDAFGGGKHAKKTESFKAYSYPGSLPGRAMGFNDAGIVVTVNALYPKRVPLGKTPRVFLNRALLSAESLDDVKAILADEGIGVATGFSANIGVFKGPNRGMWNFEVAPPSNDNERRSRVTEYAVSLFRERVDTDNDKLVCKEKGNDTDNNKLVDTDNNNDLPGDEYSAYYHFNMYDHSPDVEERPGTRTSSVRRREAAKKRPPPVGKKAVLDLLADRSDPEYPIFRRPSATDPGMTVATGLFDLDAGTWDIFLDDPSTEEEEEDARRMPTLYAE